MTKLLGARYWQSVGEVSGHISCGPGVLEIWSPRSLTEAAQGHRVQHIWHKVTTELEGIEDLKFPAVENQLSYQTRAADWILPIVKSCEISGFLYTYTHIHQSSSINHQSTRVLFVAPKAQKVDVSTVSTNHTTHPNSFRSSTCAWKNNHHMKTTCNLRLTRSFVLQT